MEEEVSDIFLELLILLGGTSCNTRTSLVKEDSKSSSYPLLK